MMSDSVSQANGRAGRVAAIYARVSSERQRQDETIQSQTVGLRELAAARGLLVVEDLVFEDEGFSGASLQRPALERLRDRAAEETFALAQARLVENAHFSKRNTRQLTLLQGVLVCRECGYSCYRTCTRTSNKRISYYRCIGQDGWRHPDGKRCTSRPVRADELDPLVWAEVRRLLETPELVRAEIDRRLAAMRTEPPAARRREALERDLTRANNAIERLIEAYQEQLISLEELRARTPALRKRQTTLQGQLDSLDAELHDAETYLKLADTLEGFLGRLADGLDQLDITAQQRVLRLVIREVLIGRDDGTLTIRP